MHFMELYTPPYILLLIAGAALQAAHALCCAKKHPLPSLVPLLGAGAVIASAWLERDIVLAFGQIFLLCIFWRIHQEAQKQRRRKTSMADKLPQNAVAMPWRAGGRLLSLPLLGLVLYIVFAVFDLSNILQETWMDTHIRQQGVKGIVLYIGLVSVLTAVGVPRQILSFLGGYVFDVLLGTLWATVGTGIACLLTFSYARYMGQQALHRKWGHKLVPWNIFLRQAPFLLTMAVRIVPLGSNFMTNIAAGISNMPALPFLAGSVAGFTVQNGIFALMGSGLHFSTYEHAVLSAVLYLLSLSLGYGIFRYYKRSQRTVSQASVSQP